MPKYRVTEQIVDRHVLPRPAKWTPCSYKGEFLWLASPVGYAELIRYERTPHAVSTAFVEYVQGRKRYVLMIQPCPTRAGLVRMACREIRRIVKEKK